MLNLSKKKPAALKLGDQIIVSGSVVSQFKAVIERISTDETGRVRIDLDWGTYGKSRVFADEEGQKWHRMENFN